MAPNDRATGERRPRLARDLKIYGLVTLVAILIWVFAEGESLQRQTRRVDLSLRGDAAPTRLVRVQSGETDWRGQVNLSLEGTTAALAGIDDELRRAIAIEPGMEGFPPDPGEQVVDLRAVLRAHEAFRNRGVTIARVEPPTITVYVYELVERTVPVRVEVPEGEADGQPVPSVETARVRLSREADAALTGTPTLVARLTSTDLAALTPGRAQQVRGVPLVPGPALVGVDPLLIAPQRVDVTITLRTRTDSIVLPNVPVHLRLGPLEQARWIVEIAPEDQALRDVRVTGPAEFIAQLRSGQRTLIAFVPLSFEELERGIAAKQAEFADLPTTVRFEAGDREVRLNIRARDESTDARPDAGGHNP